MNRYGLSKLLGACVVSLIVGCSGGSGGSGGSGEEGVLLSIHGTLIDGPTTSADIEIFIGDSLVSSFSSSDGGYTADIELDESESDEVVKIVATSQEDSKVKFASTLGTFSYLVEIAGDDGVLEQSESHAVNISSVSTAISAILESESDSVIESSDEWDEVFKKVDAERAFSVAAAIKIFIDYSERGISIPEEVEDTYQFASDFDLSSQYVSMFMNQMEGLFKEVKVAMAQEAGFLGTSSNNLNPIEGTYYLPSEGGRITLNTNGTGEYLNGSGLVELTWTQGPEGISLESVEPLVERIPMKVGEYYLSAVRERQFDRLFWMLDSKNQGMVVLETSDTLKFPDWAESDDIFETNYIAANSVRQSDLLSPKDILVIGNSYSMPTPDRDGEVVNYTENFQPISTLKSLKMSFAGDFENGGNVNIKIPVASGNGEIIESDVSAVWIVDDSDRLVVNFSDNERLYFSLLNFQNGEILNSFVERVSPDGLHSSTISTIFSKDVENWADREIKGVYLYPKNFFNPLNRFYFDISADGNISTVSINDLDNNGAIEDSERQELVGLWKLKDNGNLSIRFYRSESVAEPCISDSWNPEVDAECALFQEREWDIHQIDSADKYWFQYNVKYFEDAYLSLYDEDIDVDEHVLSTNRVYHSGLIKLSERPF
ncbi:hypothetical protein [Microbulbifer sp. VAAF005]|uniref:hypothetical protein n=1 Tax=Microbulbifer sp. VAAF005 TaxID=3034230 RepID=UPI0024AD24A9|nr:hypothetical protein [Microbulbifer sp. VAAF005]WHI44978.1 hypothetical protein P0078_14685 [Microbulbifer sp. VAAF005]